MATFKGFSQALENWCKLPLEFIDGMPLIKSLGEALVILYVIRHTWGYGDDEKRITEDEFLHGRKRRDGSRIDNGTGLSAPTVRDGIRRAVKHKFIFVDVDDHDLARVKKYYRLNVKRAPHASKKLASPRQGERSLPPSEKHLRGEKNLSPDSKKLSVRGKDSLRQGAKNLSSGGKKFTSVQRKNLRKNSKKETNQKEPEERTVSFSPSVQSNRDFQKVLSEFERRFFSVKGLDCHFFEQAWTQYPDLGSHERAMERMASETDNPNVKFYTAIVRRIHNRKKFAAMNSAAKSRSRVPMMRGPFAGNGSGTISGKLADRATWYDDEQSALIKR